MRYDKTALGVAMLASAIALIGCGDGGTPMNPEATSAKKLSDMNAARRKEMGVELPKQPKTSKQSIIPRH